MNEFYIGSVKINDPYTIANKCNDFFVNIGSTLSDNIHSPNPISHYLNAPTNNCFSFTLINEQIILDIINKLKNKSSLGYDHISKIS